MENNSQTRKGNIIYISHGGGPLPILGDPSHEKMITFMKQLPNQIEKPEAVIVISAHWEEPIPTITGSENPNLFYDYYGFPPEAYELKYPAPGNPQLARRVEKLLSKQGIKSTIDKGRGFDHGLFIPLKLMYANADIPMIQISLIRGLDPKNHINLGKALTALSEENILIIGSGFSFHNMGAFLWNNTNIPDSKNDEFQEWLINVCIGKYSISEREKLLQEWDRAPNARYCHPREEHLLPLHVCLGIAGKSADVIFDDYILGKRAIAVKW